MKKLGIAFLVFIGLLIAAIFLGPIIFRDDIIAALDKQLKKSLKAEVYYDDESIDISLIRSFPDISLAVDNVGIVGIEEFEGDTLVDIKKFGVGLDLMSVIRGDQIEVHSIDVESPSVMILVLEDGTANFDIARQTTPAAPADTATSSGLSILINEWNITEGDMIYFDQSARFYTSLNDINHSGSGNFESDIFDMVTQTTIEQVSLGIDGIEYLTDKKVVGDITMGMDFNENVFTFKDNLITVNALPLSAEGSMKMMANENIDMNFTFSGQDLSLKSILSLIPGVYNDYLDGLTASGQVDLSGYFKGIVSETSTPAIAISTDISNGRLVYADFPTPIEQINIKASLDMPGEDLSQASLIVDRFNLLFQNEKTEATLRLNDFENFRWDAFVETHMDLEKITKVIRLNDDMTLKGRINGVVRSKGSLAAIEAERIDDLPTSGEVTIDGFYYASELITEPINIANASATFSPRNISLQNLEGKLGQSDFKIDGTISNHLAYIFKENAMLNGEMNLKASYVNLDELIADSEAPQGEPTDTTAMEPVEIPRNIDFRMASVIDKITYDGLTIDNLNGTIHVQNGKVILNNNFNMLQGRFTIAGAYSTMDVRKPAFDFRLGIKDLSIPAAFKNLEMIKQFAPIADKMTGQFSTDFELIGSLDEKMSPIYSELSGGGLIEIAEAALENLKSLQALSAVSKLGDSDGIVTLKNVLMSARLEDGRVLLKPFDINVGKYETTVSGSSGIDGSLDYDLRMYVPSNSVTSTVTSTLSQLTKQVVDLNSDVVLKINMGGTFTNPEPRLAGIETTAGKSIKAAAKDKVKAEIAEQKEELKVAKDSLLTIGQVKLDSAKSEVKTETKKVIEKEVDKAKDKIKSLFKKKKNNN
ncbi:MAG: AsmA-like C-terminal region-containing protein [Cyclobacteriaceae bacterium]